MNLAGRVWTTRRLPVAFLALTVALAAGVLLAVRLEVFTSLGSSLGEGWRSVTERLPPLGDTSFLLLAGAALAALVALWLLVLACAPARRWWVMASQVPGVYAELDRAGVALLLRDAALAVPGVTAATVRIRRRGPTVRATVAFGELDRLEGQLADALDATCDVLGTVRRPRLTVTLIPSGHWVPSTPDQPQPAERRTSPPSVKEPSPEGS